MAARTGLPLLDRNPPAPGLADKWARLRVGNAWWPAPAASHAAQRARRRGLRWRLGALVAAILVVGIGVLIGQPRVYAAHLNFARAHQPLFADSLAAPTGNWTDGAIGSGAFTYADGAFVLAHDDDDSNVCCAVIAWAAPTLGDAVVQVTVRQISDAYSLGGSGLLLREDAATHTMLVFVVSPEDGQWALERQNESESGGDGQTLAYHGTLLPERAIHQGSDASNRLAVLMRGTSYAFFINDSFVGAYHDAGPKRGHVGIYTDGLSDSAAFSDFAVYPAPPPTPLLPV